MGFKSRCGRFCHWLGHCLNQNEGECLGYQEPDDEHPEGTLDLRYNGRTCWGADVTGASRTFQLNYYTYQW